MMDWDRKNIEVIICRQLYGSKLKRLLRKWGPWFL